MCTHNVAETVNFIVVALCNDSHNNSALKSASWAEGVSVFACDATSKGWPVLCMGPAGLRMPKDLQHYQDLPVSLLCWGDSRGLPEDKEMKD